MNLQLKKFDMSKMKSDQVVVFIGKRNTGKRKKIAQMESTKSIKRIQFKVV